MNTNRTGFFKSVKWLLSIIILVSAIGTNLSVAQASASGQRPLLVILLSFQDKTFDADRSLAHYKARIFGPALPNVEAYFLENSNSMFTYVPASAGDNDGTADGLVQVTMDVPFGTAPTGSEFRSQALGLADPIFNFGLYDANRDGTLQNSELTVLVVQANDGDSGKTSTAGDVTYDRVSVHGLPVPVMSQYASNYVLYHELAHAVDFYGPTGFDLYNLRDGFQQKAIMWQVNPNGTIQRAGDVEGEIAQELAAAGLPGGEAVSAYRDQNGELRLATWDLSASDNPLMKKTASAGLASDLSLAFLSPLRTVTALRQGNGDLKLIVWDINLQWDFTRRGDYTAGQASDIKVAAASASRVVVACRDSNGNLKLIAFDVSTAGELTRLGSYTAGGATEMNLVTLTSSQIVAAVRQAGGDLKLIAFDLSADGTFTRLGDYQAGIAANIDLARVSLHRVVTSVRTEAGNLKAILFDVSDQGVITRLSSYAGGQIHAVGKTAVVGLAQTRMAVSYRDGDQNLQVLTLDIQNEGGTLALVGNASAGLVPSTQLVKVSSSLFVTFVQIDGQIWTGKGFSLLGNRFVHLDPYTKLKLGWTSYTTCGPRSGPVEVFYQGQMPGQNHVVILRSAAHRANEYYIVEARRWGSTNESGLPDEGLAIWHVDEDRQYPQPFVSLEWLGGSPATALWDPANPVISLFDDSSSPAGSRWNDSSLSGISISQVESIPGGIRFSCAYQAVHAYLPVISK